MIAGITSSLIDDGISMNTKQKSSSLLLVIMIILIITSMLYSKLLLIDKYSTNSNKRRKVLVLENAFSSLNRSHFNVLNTNSDYSNINWKLYNCIFNFNKTNFGLLDLASIDQNFKTNKSDSIPFLLGNPLLQDFETVTILSESIDLILSDNSHIIGDVYLAKGTIKLKNLKRGKDFGFSSFVGDLKRDKRSIHIVEELEHKMEKFNTSQINSSKLTMRNSNEIINSFNTPINNYFSSRNIDLRNSIKGNIIIESSTSITVYKESKLQDVILKAPILKILDDVTGNFQVLSNFVFIGKNVNLTFPSLIFVDTIIGSKAIPKIYIDSASKVQGFIYCLNVKPTPLPSIELKNADIAGFIYNSGSTQMDGVKLDGKIITGKFVLNISGSSYINYISRSKIEAGLLSKYVSGPYIKGLSDSLEVMKWLD